METWRAKDMALRKKILAARERLPQVATPDAALHDCAALCIALGSDGLRGELTLLRTARALAALQSATRNHPRPLEAVAPMALSHRLRRDPLDEAGSGTRVARTRGGAALTDPRAPACPLGAVDGADGFWGPIRRASAGSGCAPAPARCATGCWRASLPCPSP